MPPAPPLKLEALVERETLESLRRLFERVTGVPMVFTDAEHRPIVSVEDPLRFCGTLVRSEDGSTLCLRRSKWDIPEAEVEEALRQTDLHQETVTHRCTGGFRDTAVPVVVEGQTIGFVVFARTRVEPPDIESFRAMASEAGMAPEVGEAVARRALVMSSEQVSDLAALFRVIAGLVAGAAYDSLRLQQVLRLEKLRDELTHMIVHDLRTPLTSIIGGLDLILSSEYDPAILQEFVPLAHGSAAMLLEMVNTLLDINKMESGQMELQVAPVDLRELADTAVDRVRGLAAERRHSLTTETCEGCTVVDADGEKLSRVLINLLGNAIKFTQDGGTIVLRVACDEDGVTLSVADNGPGIPEEYRERIFEKFGQVDTAGARRRHSTGLGLTFCKMVAEAHGGRVWVDSEVGKGSTFSVFIPYERPTRQAT